jgi:hypothetical protein
MIKLLIRFTPVNYSLPTEKLLIGNFSNQFHFLLVLLFSNPVKNHSIQYSMRIHLTLKVTRYETKTYSYETKMYRKRLRQRSV